MAPDLSLFQKNDYYSRILILILLGTDIVSFVYATKILEFQSDYFITDSFRPYAFISTLSWIIAATVRNLYISRHLHTVKSIFEKHLEILPVFALLQACTFILLDTDATYLIPILSLNLYALVVTVSVKSLFLTLYRQLRQLNKTRYIVVGYTQAGQRLHHYLQKQKKYGYQFMGYYDDHHKNHPLVKGGLKDINQFCLRHKVDQIYLAIPDQTELVYMLSAFADNHYMYFGYVIDSSPLQENLLVQPEIYLPSLSTSYRIIGLPN